MEGRGFWRSKKTEFFLLGVVGSRYKFRTFGVRNRTFFFGGLKLSCVDFLWESDPKADLLDRGMGGIIVVWGGGCDCCSLLSGGGWYYRGVGGDHCCLGGGGVLLLFGRGGALYGELVFISSHLI